MSRRPAAALLAALALLLLGGCGGEGGGRSAGEVLKRASEKPAKSADVDMSLVLKVEGVEQLKGPVRLTLKGPYRSNGAQRMPDFDFRIGYDAAGRKGNVRVVGAESNAFVEYNGQTYEVGRDVVRRYLRRSQSGAQQEQIRKLGIDGADWIKDGEVEDDGRSVRGELDVPRMLADINRVIAKTPGGRRIPQSTVEQIDQSVTDASLDVKLGPDDVLRSSTFNVAFELSEELRSKARGLRGGSVTFRFGQSNVNGSQRIEPPAGARPIAELLRSFGVPPEALLGPGVTPQAPG